LRKPGAEDGGVSGRQRGVIIYGHEVAAVAAALCDLDPRYVPADHVIRESGQVPVLVIRQAAEADAARDAAPDVAWLVVDLYRPDAGDEHAREPLLWLNTTKVDPETAARAIDQPDLLTLYEITDPVRVVTADGGPIADGYSNLAITVPPGSRMVAHAVREGETPPECLHGAQRVLSSRDLWALSRSRNIDRCRACALRHAG
jgi:hypothetical protein